MDQDDLKPDKAAERLVHAAGGSMPHEPGGSVRAALANAMVGMKKQFYGRGPTAAKAWILDEYVFVALEGGLTRNEETMLADGKEDVVRSYRLSFQETMTEIVTQAVRRSRAAACSRTTARSCSSRRGRSRCSCSSRSRRPQPQIAVARGSDDPAAAPRPAARLLSAERREAARTALPGPCRPLRRANGRSRATAEHLGVLLLDGVVAHDVLMAGVASTELLGPGDVLQPWAREHEPLLRRTIRWQVLAETRVALLDRRFSWQLSAWPEVNAALMGRLASARSGSPPSRRSPSSRASTAACSRSCWHLAERWGRVTADGVLVPLTLSHPMLGQIVGARPPPRTGAVRGRVPAGALGRGAAAGGGGGGGGPRAGRRAAAGGGRRRGGGWGGGGGAPPAAPAGRGRGRRGGGGGGGGALENAIARPASSGLSRPAAASGIAATL